MFHESRATGKKTCVTYEKHSLPYFHIDPQGPEKLRQGVEKLRRGAEKLRRGVERTQTGRVKTQTGRGDGRGWVCSAGHTCGDAEKRWVVLLEIVDHSGSMQVTAFDDVARAILGCRFWFFQFSSFLLCSVWGCFGVVIG